MRVNGRVRQAGERLLLRTLRQARGFQTNRRTPLAGGTPQQVALGFESVDVPVRTSYQNLLPAIPVNIAGRQAHYHTVLPGPAIPVHWLPPDPIGPDRVSGSIQPVHGLPVAARCGAAVTQGRERPDAAFDLSFPEYASVGIERGHPAAVAAEPSVHPDVQCRHGIYTPCTPYRPRFAAGNPEWRGIGRIDISAGCGQRRNGGRDHRGLNCLREYNRDGLAAPLNPKAGFLLDQTEIPATTDRVRPEKRSEPDPCARLERCHRSLYPPRVVLYAPIVRCHQFLATASHVAHAQLRIALNRTQQPTGQGRVTRKVPPALHQKLS